MYKFLRLVQNENMKLFRKTSTLIMILMLIGAIITVGAITKYNGLKEDTDWRQNVKNETVALKQQLSHTHGDAAKALKKQIAVNEYRLAHNIPPLSNRSIWGFTNNATDMMLIITIFTIIIAGGIVSGEFHSGTIKLLLTKPVSRSTVLLSKYVTVLFAGLSFSALSLIGSWLTGGVLFGFTDLDHPALTVLGGKVVEENMLVHVLAVYGLDFVQLIVMATIAFMISSAFRNTSLAIGLTIFAMMGGQLVLQLLARYDWVKYVLFANLDLSGFFGTGQPPVEGLTLGFSITVLLVYYAVFIAIGWVAFTRRDV